MAQSGAHVVRRWCQAPLRAARHRSVTFLLLTLIATGCGRGAAIPASTPETPVDGGTMRYAQTADPVSVTPLFGGDEAGMVVERNVFAGLVDVDPATLRIVPAIARSWKSSADGRTFTFDLRPGVRFQKAAGDVTAETFARDWSLLCSPAVGSPNSSALSAVAGYQECRNGSGSLSGVHAAGPLKLVVTLERPFLDFATVLADPATWAFPPETAATPTAIAAFESRPVGAGPFQIESWARREVVPGKAIVPGEMVLARNPLYYGDRPHLDRVDLPVVDAANPAQSFARYRRHGLDVLDVADSQVDVVRADPTFSRQLVGYPRLQLIALVAADQGASTVEQRAALAAAIDPSAVVSDVFGKSGQTADGLVPPGTPGFLPGVAPPQAGGTSSAATGTVTLQRPTQPLLQAIADSIMRRLSNAGVSAKLSAHGAYRLQVLDARYPSPDAFLALATALAGASPAPLDTARAASDPVQRDALYVAAERALLAQRRLMPIAFGQTQLLVAPRIRGLLYDALGAPRLSSAWISAR